MCPFSKIYIIAFNFHSLKNSVAILQYLAEKYGQNSGCAAVGKFYPVGDPIQRSVVHHRLSFHLSTYQRRVYDYMILPMDYDYERTEENRIKLTHALGIFDEFLRRQQEPDDSSSSSGNLTAGAKGLYAAGGMCAYHSLKLHYYCSHGPMVSPILHK